MVGDINQTPPDERLDRLASVLISELTKLGYLEGKAKRKPAPLDESNKWWNRDMMAAWRKAFGGELAPWSLKLVRPLVERHGKTVVLEAFARYAAKITDARFASVKRFAETFGQYMPKAPVSREDAYVQLTDKG